MVRILCNAWFIPFTHAMPDLIMIAMIQRIFIFLFFFGNSSNHSPLFAYAAPFHTLSAFRLPAFMLSLSYDQSPLCSLWPMQWQILNTQYNTKVCTESKPNRNGISCILCRMGFSFAFTENIIYSHDRFEIRNLYFISF